MIQMVAGDVVQLTVSDPWEFVTACGSGPFPGRVVRYHRVGEIEQAVILMSKDLVFGAARARYFVITPRHEGHPLAAADGPSGVPCNAIGVSGADVAPTAPFHFHPSKALLSLIGSIRLSHS